MVADHAEVEAFCGGEGEDELDFRSRWYSVGRIG